MSFSSDGDTTFNEHTFLNRTRPPQSPSPEALISQTSSKRAPKSHRKQIRSSKPVVEVEAESEYEDVDEEEEDEEPSMDLTSATPRRRRSNSNPEIVTPPKERTSHFFASSKAVPRSNPRIEPEAVLDAENSKAGRRRRESSPPWEIDWAAEGLSAPTSDRDENQPEEQSDAERRTKDVHSHPADAESKLHELPELVEHSPRSISLPRRTPMDLMQNEQNGTPERRFNSFSSLELAPPRTQAMQREPPFGLHHRGPVESYPLYSPISSPPVRGLDQRLRPLESFSEHIPNSIPSSDEYLLRGQQQPTSHAYHDVYLDAEQAHYVPLYLEDDSGLYDGYGVNGAGQELRPFVEDGGGFDPHSLGLEARPTHPWNEPSTRWGVYRSNEDSSEGDGELAQAADLIYEPSIEVEDVIDVSADDDTRYWATQDPLLFSPRDNTRLTSEEYGNAEDVPQAFSEHEYHYEHESSLRILKYPVHGYPAATDASHEGYRHSPLPASRHVDYRDIATRPSYSRDARQPKAWVDDEYSGPLLPVPYTLDDFGDDIYEHPPETLGNLEDTFEEASSPIPESPALPSSSRLSHSDVIPEHFQQGKALLLGVDQAFPRSASIGQPSRLVQAPPTYGYDGNIEEIERNLALQLERDGYWDRSGRKRRG